MINMYRNPKKITTTSARQIAIERRLGTFQRPRRSISGLTKAKMKSAMATGRTTSWAAFRTKRKRMIAAATSVLRTCRE